MPQNNSIGFSPEIDIPAVNIADRAPERMIRVYPYELVNSKDSKGFIAPQSVSIVTVSQENFNAETGMKQDKYGNWYFEALADVQLQAKLDTSTATSTSIKVFKEEVQFTLQSNAYYESGMERIMVGNTYFNPAVFTIGAPLHLEFVNHPNYVPSWYENNNGEFIIVTDKTILNKLGTGSDQLMKDKEFNVTTEEEEMKYIFFIDAGQEVYIATTTLASAEYNASPDILNNDGLYEVHFTNISAIIESYPNSAIQFTKNVVNKDVTSFHIKMNSSTILPISFMKIKGDKETNNNITKDTDISLNTTEPMVPFKFTPAFTKDKLTIYSDWFDYDTVFPWYKVNTPDKVTLDELLDNVDDDIKLIEDMILISYLYTTSFKDAPVILDDTKNQYGKLDPGTTIGHAGISVSKIANKPAVSFIDGMYEKHIRKFPEVLSTKGRYQKLQAVMNALCRFISTSHSIGKGGNAYGWAYLPWYLLPTAITVTITGADQHKVLMLSPIKFNVASIYFNEKFTQANVNGSSSFIKLPKIVNTSNNVLLQTDRKLTLPEVPYQLSDINKLPLPGDINTASSQALKYISFLPFKTEDALKSLYLKNASFTPPNTNERDYQIDNATFFQLGKIKTNKEIVDYISEQTGGGQPKSTIATSNQPTHITLIHNDNGSDANDNFTVTYNGKSYTIPFTDDIIKHNGVLTLGIDQYQVSPKNVANYVTDWISKKFNWDKRTLHISPAGWLKMKEDFSLVEWDEGFFEFTGVLDIKSDMTLTIDRQVMGVIRITGGHGASGKISFADRKLLFDNTEWSEFVDSLLLGADSSYELKPNINTSIKKIDTIVFSSIFCHSLTLDINSVPIKIPMFSHNDETISTQKIIFT